MADGLRMLKDLTFSTMLHRKKNPQSEEWYINLSLKEKKGKKKEKDHLTKTGPSSQARGWVHSLPLSSGLSLPLSGNITFGREMTEMTVV